MDGTPTHEEVRQAHIIASRTKLWTPEVEKLLRQWKRQIGHRQVGHRRKGRLCNAAYYMLGIPNAVLAAVVSTGILATFQDCVSPPNSERCVAEEWVRFTIGLIGLVSVIISGAATFLDLGGAREKHKNADDAYGELVRAIETTLLLPLHMRSDPVAFIQTTRDRFDDTVKSSPSIGSRYDHSLEWKTLEPATISPLRALSMHLLPGLYAEPPASTTPRPEGMTQEVPDPDSLARLLVEKVDQQAKNVILARRKVAELNNYDSDDERPVTITFDPSAVRPGETEIDLIRRDAQQSMAEALKFELSRFLANSERGEQVGRDDREGRRYSARHAAEVPTPHPYLPREQESKGSRRSDQSDDPPRHPDIRAAALSSDQEGDHNHPLPSDTIRLSRSDSRSSD